MSSRSSVGAFLTIAVFTAIGAVVLRQSLTFPIPQGDPRLSAQLPSASSDAAPDQSATSAETTTSTATTSSTTSTPAPYCGDGIRQSNEACDPNYGPDIPVCTRACELASTNQGDSGGGGGHAGGYPEEPSSTSTSRWHGGIGPRTSQSAMTAPRFVWCCPDGAWETLDSLVKVGECPGISYNPARVTKQEADRRCRPQVYCCRHFQCERQSTQYFAITLDQAARCVQGGDGAIFNGDNPVACAYMCQSS
ncbi:MAG: hypothetical protein G01um101425_369 [Candidatus Peregrinibacteria bacterium Gr01-1014_25]|nr:MAG: hypothetical protein G01um101425_369 [Candidatus Peregrinibacteria bacterium Gr01-1014_25]